MASEISPLTILPETYETFGARPAVVLRGRYRRRELSYRQLARAALGTATRLRAAGIQAGDRILLRGPDSPEWVASFLGCLRAGAVPVPLELGSDDALAVRIRRRAGCVAAILPAEDPWNPGIPRFALECRTEDAPAPPPVPRTRADVLEVVFTSGTTQEPRGVTITHGNVLAYMEPIQRGYRRRRWYVQPLLPLPILCLPPLSHMFGQSVGIFIPLMLGCTVVFLEERNPAAIRRAIRSEKIWLTMAVPRLLDLLTTHLRAHAEQRGWNLDEILRQAGTRGPLRRAWMARKISRWLGWRHRGFVVGGARLPLDLEVLWRGLGFLLVQGYGLTETAPVVTLTHPFRPRVGSVGRPLGSQEIRLADDGEILVRGPNVMSGYWDDRAATRKALDADGWLHTGDLGRREADGSLRILGRKKEVIVLPDGRNVHPQDVERALRLVPGLRDAVVVGAGPGPGEQVHAALLLEPDTSPEAAITAANRELEAYQRIRGFTLWPTAEFPRTATGKVRRREVRRHVQALAQPGIHPEGAPSGSGVADPVERVLLQAGIPRERLREEARLEDLGLASLDLVEIAAALEGALGVEIPDGSISGALSVGSLREIATHPPPEPVETSGLSVPLPRWPRSAAFRLLRGGFRSLCLQPALSLIAPMKVQGHHHLPTGDPPALLVSNHLSLLDVPVLLRALPGAWRRRVAPAMTAEYFRPWLRPEGSRRTRRYLRGLQWLLATALFQAFLLPRGQGFRDSLRHAGDLLDEGACVLVFPEGTRSAAGLGPFQGGVGLMAAELGVPVIPAHLAGLDRVLPPGARWPRRAFVEVRFGPAIRREPTESPEALTRRLHQAVRDLAGGRPTD